MIFDLESSPLSVVYRFIAKTLVDAYRSCTLPPSAKFRVQNARLTSSRDGSEDGVAVNRGRQGRWNGGDGGPLFNRRGKGGEERKGSELGGNKVSLIPSLFFRQSSFLMEIARRGFLCNFFLLSFSFLFFSFFFLYLYYYRLPISFASDISLYKKGFVGSKREKKKLFLC